MEQKIVQIMFVLGLVLLQVSISQSKGIVVAEKGRTSAKILISSVAANSEKIAAEDLAKYIEKMTGAKPEIISTEQEIS